MSVNKCRALGLRVWLAASLLVGSLMAGDPPPSLDSPDLARGPYSSMHMMLQKTFLKINVATIDVRFGKQSQARLADLARGQQYSEELEGKLAKAAIGADRALVQMRFQRDVSLDRWMGVVRDNLDQAHEAGLISAELKQRVSQALPDSFAPLRERGYMKGDRLLYSVSPDALRSVVVSTDGQILVDRTDRDQTSQRVVLASYFAPGSDFREPLIRSFFGDTK